MKTRHTNQCHQLPWPKKFTKCFSAAFRVTKSLIHDFPVFSTLYAINLYFAWLLCISVCDNAGYTSCNMKYRVSKEEFFFSNEALTELIMKSYPHIRLWHSLSTFHVDLLLESWKSPWKSPMTATQLCAFLLQSSFSMLLLVNLVLWNVMRTWPVPEIS